MNKDIEKTLNQIQGILAGIGDQDCFFLVLSKITKEGIMNSHVLQGFDNFQAIGVLENLKQLILESMKKVTKK